MMRYLLFAAFAFLYLAGFGQQHTDIAPKLIIGINIEHFRAEYLNRYWDSFQLGGFKRLATGGAVFENTRADIHNIKPSTMLASVYTGSYPAVHGIVGDKWYHQLSGKEVDAVKDDFYLTLGSDSKLGNISAKRLKVFTLGDALKHQTNFRSKVFSVALNANSATLAAGHAADGAFWFDHTNGNFISSSYYLDKFPNWVMEFNQKKFAQLYLQRDWDLLLPISSYKASFVDNYVLEKGFWNKWNTFPYKLSRIAKDQEYPLEIIKATPFGNRMVRDFAVQLATSEKLGLDEYPDLLNITFSTMDYANKWYNPQSVEIQETYIRLDVEIASLLSFFDKELGKDNYVVFLTSASTSSYPINMLKDEFNVDAGEFSPQSALALMRAYLNAIYGVGDWVKMYNEEQVYLDHNLISKKEIPLNDIREKVANFLNQFTGVKAALPAHLIEFGNLNNPRFRIIENSYSVQRSGDVVLILDEGWYPTYRFQQVDYTTENRVPLIFYGMQVKQGKHYQKTEIIDIVPTLCRMLKIIPPDHATGNVLENVFW
jgi:predicted AlkP superfamily pyrophosphatase or phosphodiesterase